MSGTIGITCTVQSAVKKKELYFKAIDVLETTYSSVKLSYLTNLDKPVNSVNFKTLKEPQPKFTYTAGPFYVTCKSDTNFEYRDNTLIINEECTEIEISNKDIATPAECSISINNPSVKIILNGVNIKNTLERDAIYASQYRKRIDINLHIKENTTNTIESINTGINLEDTSGGAITGNFLISGDNNDNAKLEIKGNNNYNAILSTAANIKISGGNLSIKKVDTDKDLIITGGKTLFKTNTSGLGSYSWSVGGNITIDNAVAVFEAVEPFGKYSLENTKSSSNITIGKSAVVSGANDFYYACKECNAGFSTCNTGIEMNKYTILEDGTIFVKEDVEYWQPDGAGEGFIGKDTKMRFKKINLSTGFGLTNNGTIEIQGADVITGMSGRLINNGTIDNYGEIGEVSGYGFGLENNGVINNYNKAKLYVLENITGSGNINQIATTPETTLILSGQEGIDWVQEADHYLIKNTCTEITLSGSTTKEIRTESGGNDLNIILSNLNAPTSQITFNKNISIHIQKNTINNLKCIYNDSNYYYLTIYADNNDNCILNLEKDNRNSSIAARNIIINNGIINAKGNITCKSSGNLKIELNNGIVNTPRFGGDYDAYTDEIVINNGILFTDTIGCSRDDGSGTKIKFLGGIVRFTEWQSYILSEIADSAVIITPKQYIFDRLKSENKGLIIQSLQFTSIDSLKIFDIDNETEEIIIKEPLTLKNNNNSNSIEDKMIINNGCKVISNNLYFEDGTGNISRAPEKPTYEAAILNNNGILIVNIGTRLYVNCLVPIYLHHENNGIIYNLGEIDGKNFLKGTGRIVELELTAEVNGELYNDITVDKVNRTVNIDNLTPETDYDINLIASLEPYIERSKTIKQKIELYPPKKLVNGSLFNEKIKQLSNNKSIFFKRESFIPKPNGTNIIDVSEKQDESIVARIVPTSYYNSEIHISSKSIIIANEDCSNMFKDFSSYIIDFNNFDTKNIKIYDNMFKNCTGLKTDFEVTNKEMISCTGMLENTSIRYNFILSGEEKIMHIIDKMMKTKSSNSKIVFSKTNILLDGPEFNKKLRELEWPTKPEIASQLTTLYIQENKESIDSSIYGPVDVSKAQDNSILAFIYRIYENSKYSYKFTIQSKGKIVAGEDASYMFASTINKNDAPSNWSNMEYIMNESNNLLKNTTNIEGMFKGLSKLEFIPSFIKDFSKIQNSSKLFSGCLSIADHRFVTVESYNTVSLENCSYMFEECNLPVLSLIRWNTSRITDMTGMFKNATNVSGGILIKNKNIKATNISGGTHNRSNFYINYTPESKDAVIKLVNASTDIKLGDDISILDKERFLEAYKMARKPSDKNPYPYPGNSDKFYRKKAPYEGIDISEEQDGSIIADINNNGLQVYSEKSIMILDGSNMFPEPNQYSSIPDNKMPGTIDLSENFNLTCCKNISYMFDHNDMLMSLNLTNVDTSNVEDARSLFGYCFYYQTEPEVTGLNSLDFTSLKYGSHMFTETFSRLNIDWNHFAFSNLSEGNYMFSSGITSLKISLVGNKSSSIDYFDHMFYFSGEATVEYSDEYDFVQQLQQDSQNNYYGANITLIQI